MPGRRPWRRLGAVLHLRDDSWDAAGPTAGGVRLPETLVEAEAEAEAEVEAEAVDKRTHVELPLQRPEVVGAPDGATPSVGTAPPPVPPPTASAPPTPSTDEPVPDAGEGWAMEPQDEAVWAMSPRRNASHAVAMMLGSTAALRIEGSGLARQVLDTAPVGDPRFDLGHDERALVAATRAWCLAVHSDLAIGNIEDDPILLAEAERCALTAYDLRPADAQVMTTVALVRLRQRRLDEAVQWAERSVGQLQGDPMLEEDGRVAATMAVALLVLAIARWRLGDASGAATLAQAALAWHHTLEIDDVGFAALLAEVDHVPTLLLADPPPDAPDRGPAAGGGGGAPVAGPPATAPGTAGDGTDPTARSTGPISRWVAASA